MFIVPLGGIGNRWRVVESLLSNDRNIKITIIDIRTNYFPLCFNQVFNVPKNINIISIPLVWNDFFMVKITKIFTIFLQFFAPNTIRYGCRNYLSAKIHVTPHAFEVEKYLGLITLKDLSDKDIFSGPFNAVHIRRTDNKNAILKNPLEKFFDFIEISDLPVYLATDDIDLKKKIIKKFGSKILTQELNLQRGSKQAFLDTFSEISNLVKADKFLGSINSSFTRLVENLRLHKNI